MKYIVKQADLLADRDRMLNILKNNRTRDASHYEKRYDWIYLDNPDGQAIPWIIWDAEKGIPMGFTAVFPRRMFVKGKILTCWNCGDFSIEKNFRTLGIALQLRKEAKRAVDDGRVPFLYAHPNNRMAVVHLRAGHKQLAFMKRYALPIRLSKYLRRKPMLEEITATIVDPLILNLLKMKYHKLGDYEVYFSKELKFSDAHLGICEHLNKHFPVIGLRDTKYLAWKYKNNPINQYYLYNYYENSLLVGYIIYFIQRNVLNLSEIVAKYNINIQRRMFSTFLYHVIKKYRDVQVISTIVQEFNPVIPALMDLGFKYRNDATTPVITYTADEDLKPIVLDGNKWFMNLGDRDS